MALAPPQTQLLLLSGSVANPQDVVKWLQRLGRKAVLVRHDERPVPLDEVHANSLSYHVPSEIRGYWPRLVAKALAEDLGPILIFAPRRQAAESMANELARQLPTPNPAPAQHRAEAGRRRTSGQAAQEPRHLSSQRLELRRPGGRHRAARQGRPTPGRRRHHGPGRRHQLLPAQRRPRRRILPPRRGRATAQARRAAANVRPRRPPGPGRNRLRADHRQRTAPAGLPSGPPLAQRRGGLVRPARHHDRRRPAWPRPLPRGRAHPGTALHHQAHRPRRRGILAPPGRPLRSADRRRARPPRPQARPRNAEQPRRVGDRCASR